MTAPIAWRSDASADITTGIARAWACHVTTPFTCLLLVQLLCVLGHTTQLVLWHRRPVQQLFLLERVLPLLLLGQL